MAHTLCHAPGCSAKAVRGWTRCARHYTGGRQRSEIDTMISRLTEAQRVIHADVQLHGVVPYTDQRRLPAIQQLAGLGLVEFHETDGVLIVRLPPAESARLKGPWRRDELRSAAGGDIV